MRARGVALLLLALTAGCGHSPPPNALATDAARVQAAATRGTAGDLAAAAAALRVDLGQRLVAGDLDLGRAAAILDQLSRVLADASVRPSPVVRPPATTPKPSAPAHEAPAHEKDKKGDGEGGD